MDFSAFLTVYVIPVRLWYIKVFGGKFVFIRHEGSKQDKEQTQKEQNTHTEQYSTASTLS